MVKQKKDFIWNTLGSISFSATFPLLTVAISRVLDAEQSGLFSVAFVTSQLMMIIGNYAVRIYQVSDIREEYSYKEYYIHRYTTCFIMMIVGIFFINFKGYIGKIFLLNILLCFYKMIDALADVYEGRLQQMDFLDKAGKSLFFRTFLSTGIFIMTLISFKDIYLSTLSMIFVSIVILVIMSILPAHGMKSKNRNCSLIHVIDLYRQCGPLFISLFLFNYVVNSPKYEIEKVFPYEYQTHFNALYFPAQVIFLLSNFIFKPLIISMTNYWNNIEEHSMLNKLIIKIFGLVFLLVIVSSAFMYMFGISILGWLYQVDLSMYKGISIIMMINGGFIACINFMYFVLTIMRKQNLLMLSYISGFLCSIFIFDVFIQKLYMWGVVLAYMLILFIIFSSLLFFYVKEMSKTKVLSNKGG